MDNNFESKSIGDAKMFQVLFTITRDGLVEACEALSTPDGCVLRSRTQVGHAICESMVYVPGVKLAPDTSGGMKLVALHDAPPARVPHNPGIPALVVR